tara:strand:+ start:812 stop:1366 length:555 start_codon:yes stop_codon:yes gene_type:complete
MSTTQKLSIKGLKIGKDQFDLLVSTVKGLVGEAGTVTAKEKLSDGGLRIRSNHAVAQNSQFADIKIRFHGASADVGIYVSADGQIDMAWDGYVVRGNTQLKDSFEGRADRHTFEKNLNARFVMETLRETAERKGFSATEITRVSNKKEKTGHFEMELDTGGFGMSSFDDDKQTNSLSGGLGGGF